MPTIEERIVISRWFDNASRCLISEITLDEDTLTLIKTPLNSSVDLLAYQAEQAFVKKLMEDWPCQDQTLITE